MWENRSNFVDLYLLYCNNFGCYSILGLFDISIVKKFHVFHLILQ